MISVDERLQGVHVTLATHEVGTVPVQVLEAYLQDRVRGLLFMHHPLQYLRMASGNRSYARTYGTLAGRRLLRAPRPIDVEPIAYLKDAFLSVLWVMQCRARFDLFVGAGNLNAFTGLLLRQLGLVKKAVYYAIDYMPDRFDNRLMNRIYRLVEKACVQHCDATWNVSQAMIDARSESGIATCRPQLVVPIGAHVSRLPRAHTGKIDRQRIVFMGNLLESHGLQLVLRAMTHVREHVPDVHLVVYGHGPYRGDLEELTSSLGLTSIVQFRGYIQDHAVLDQELARGGIAVATYEPQLAVFTRFADPGKVKNYLAAGLPIVMTAVPPIASALRDRCARVVPYDVSACAAALESLLLDDASYFTMRECALALAQDIDWTVIFDHALSATLGDSAPLRQSIPQLA